MWLLYLAHATSNSLGSLRQATAVACPKQFRPYEYLVIATEAKQST
jgi:hypothetical protein